jgi:hypothetical protein
MFGRLNHAGNFKDNWQLVFQLRLVATGGEVGRPGLTEGLGRGLVIKLRRRRGWLNSAGWHGMAWLHF